MSAGAELQLRAVDETQLGVLARALAPPLREGGVVYLRGDLGAGKTTFARALLAALGVGERIKSPTYSLIESYAVGELALHHLDLYRIAAPGELEWLGLADLAHGRYLLLVEWPERAHGTLPEADLVIELAHAPVGRDLQLRSGSPRGQQWLQTLRASTALNAIAAAS